MSKLDKIKKTIEGLRAKASDEATTESEAMAALDMVDTLLQKHGLTLEDLEAESETGLKRVYWTKGTRKLHPVERIAHAVTLLTETRGWVETGPEIQSLVFYGFEADTEVALYLVDLIYNSMEFEWAEFRKTDQYASIPTNKRGKTREDFMRGMCTRIRQRIVDIVASRRTQTTSSTGTDLVVAKRSMIADALAQEEMEIAPRRSRKAKVNASAYLAGLSAGSRTRIVEGIEK